MQNADSTLHDFVLKLLTEAPCRQAFDLDPVAALHDAGLSDVSPQDVVDAIPLALDFASAHGGDFHFSGEAGGTFGEFEAGGSFSGGTDGLAGGGSVETPFGGGGFRVEGGTDGNVDIQAGVGAPQGGALLDVTASPTGGLSLSSSFGSEFGGGGFDLNLGLDGVSGGGGFDLEGPDALGRGGDLVTGTVASYLTDGADSLTGALTDHAGALSGGLGSGADTVDGLVHDGASQLTNAVQDPTSIDVPTISPSGLPELPVDLPVGDLPAMPELPGLPATPGLPGLPGLGDLPVDLPVDLPELPVQLPEVPGLPEAPGLPSVPGVTDVVGGVTGNVPVVSDLTDGLGEGLLGH